MLEIEKGFSEFKGSTQSCQQKDDNKVLSVLEKFLIDHDITDDGVRTIISADHHDIGRILSLKFSAIEMFDEIFAIIDSRSTSYVTLEFFVLFALAHTKYLIDIFRMTLDYISNSTTSELACRALKLSTTLLLPVFESCGTEDPSFLSSPSIATQLIRNIINVAANKKEVNLMTLFWRFNELLVELTFYERLKLPSEQYIYTIIYFFNNEFISCINELLTEVYQSKESIGKEPMVDNILNHVSFSSPEIERIYKESRQPFNQSGFVYLCTIIESILDHSISMNGLIVLSSTSSLPASPSESFDETILESEITLLPVNILDLVIVCFQLLVHFHRLDHIEACSVYVLSYNQMTQICRILEKVYANQLLNDIPFLPNHSDQMLAFVSSAFMPSEGCQISGDSYIKLFNSQPSSLHELFQFYGVIVPRMCELIEETIIMEDISNACILSKLLGSMISFLFFSVSNFVNESDAREEITTPDSSIAFWVNRYYQVFCQVILQSKYTTSLMQLLSLIHI